MNFAAGRYTSETSTAIIDPQKQRETAHITSRLVRGESTCILLKCIAVTGTAKTITLNELERIPIR